MALLLAAPAAACGRRSPTEPSTSTAAIVVSSFTVTAQTAPGDTVYHVAFQLKETSGSAGAAIHIVSFVFPAVGELSADAHPAASNRIAPGGTYDSGTTDFHDRSGAAPVSQVSLWVGFTDDEGHDGSVKSSASVAQP